jgi:cellulose synthase/poly-beta-1,6-N-acetylglucosamine synthase-like glycosyltransferase
MSHTAANLILNSLNIIALPFVVGLYAVSLTALLLRGRRAGAAASAHRRFLIVIPAHDEESGIGATVASCRSVDYPTAQFEILVIADNCTDGTARAAADAGARVVEREDPVRKSKGHALEYLFNQLFSTGEDSRFDAVIIIDADTRVDANLLREFSRVLDEGHDWSQCYYTVSNADETPYTRLMTYAFSLFNGVWLFGQNRLGLSSALRGNGMCFSLAGLRRVPWKAHGLTEDVEFSWTLRTMGEHVHFTRQTRVYGEMVGRLDEAAAGQRQRWERGRSALRNAVTDPLLKSSRLGLAKKVVYLLDLYFPPLVPLATFLLALAVLDLYFYLIHVNHYAIIYSVVLVGSLLLYGVCPFFVMGLPARYALDLVYVPIYTVWKATVALRKQPTQWVRTPRGRL